MEKILYRKSDLVCVGTVTSGMTLEQEINLNVIPNFGGAPEDYAYIETDEVLFHLELIDDVVTVVKDDPPVVVQPPSDAERISALEDALLMLL